MKKKELIIIIVATLLILILGSIYIFGFKKGKIVPQASSNAAVLSVSPGSGTRNVGSTFNADIKIDTGGAQTDIVSLVINYDPNVLEVVDQDAQKQGVNIIDRQYYPNNISNYVSGNKIIFESGLAMSNPQPVSGTGTVATIVFKALRNADNTAVDIAFQENSTSMDYSGVAEHGTARNILGAANDGNYKIITPQPLPTADVKANNSNGPITIDQGQSANLSWSSTNANSCTASGSWSGSLATSGSRSTGSITSVQTYTLTCTNSAGSARDSVTVNVRVPNRVPPTVDLKINGSDEPATIEQGSSANLTWTSSNAASCSASGDWSGAKSTSGSEGTGNLDSSKNYVLTCTGEGGETADNVTVNVTPKADTGGETENNETPTNNNTETPTNETTNNTPAQTNETTNNSTPKTNIVSKLPSNIKPTPTPTATKNSVELYKNETMKPWALWFLYAIIPAFLAGLGVYFYLRKKKQPLNTNKDIV